MDLMRSYSSWAAARAAFASWMFCSAWGTVAFAASRRVCSLATACLAASSLTFAWSRAVWASAALDSGGILSLGQLLDSGIAPLAEGIEIGVDLAVPIGLLGLHVGLRRIQLGLLLIERLLGVCKLGVCLVEFGLEGIELTAGGILGRLGIGYLLLEVGNLSLGLVDALLGLLDGLLRGMDRCLGVGPYLLGGLDLLERACASRLCGLVGCSSLLGSLCSVGSLCGGDIICGLGLGQLLVGCSLGIGRGLYIGLTCLSVGGCLIVCGAGRRLVPTVRHSWRPSRYRAARLPRPACPWRDPWSPWHPLRLAR